MDLVASCKDKMTYFRIKDLKDVLGQLGLSKQGKKQDLVDRILAILSDDQVSGILAKKNSKEKVTKLIEDAYRKIQGSGAAGFVSKSEVVPECTSAKLKEEIEDSFLTEKIRCLCGSVLQTDSMIKCEDPSCNVWQHIACVLIPEKPMTSILPNIPDVFYCEVCRLTRADPFWMTVSNILLPVKLSVTGIPSDGSNPSQSVEKTFQLTRAQRDMVTKQEYDVQAWCMLLNDNVTFRMHWPQYADLQVNGIPVRAINRPGAQLLGANGRDDGPIITQCTRDGINKIFLGGCDARTFCLGVRIVKRRTLPQILNMIPKEDEGESFEDALSRVRSCVGGAPDADNADSGSDIEVISECIPVNLRCPMSGLRMKVAGRFKGCAHMGCFDLEVFVEMNQRSRKWQCPICLKNYSLEKIIIDPYFNRITSMMRSCDEDIAEIEVKPDGSWRAKVESGDRKSFGELGLWHSPDGTVVSATAVGTTSQLERRPLKEEIGPNGYSALRMDFKNNPNDFLEFSDAMQSISNAFDENFECNLQNIIPMSSSATINGRDCEDGSVNQDPEYESFDPSAQRSIDRLIPAAGGNLGTDIIVLSDSEDDMDLIQSAGAAYMNTGSDKGSDKGGLPFAPAPHHGIPDSYYADPATDRGFDLYGAHDEDFPINMWSMPSTSQGVPGLQLFGSELDVPDTLLDMQHSSLHCTPPIDDFTLTRGTEMGSTAPAYKTDMDDSLVDNPLGYRNDDPSLQIFLPTRPSDALASHSDLGNHSDVPNGIGNEDWISLRLGAGAGVSQNEYAAVDTPIFTSQQQSRTAPLGPIADNGQRSFESNANDQPAPGKNRRERSEAPFPSLSNDVPLGRDYISQSTRTLVNNGNISERVYSFHSKLLKPLMESSRFPTAIAR